MAAVIALAPSIPQLTGACSIAVRYRYFELAPVAGDTTPPMDVSVDVIVDRDDNFVACACGQDCPEMSYLVFEPRATDDNTAPSRIGYRFSLVAGEIPPSLDLGLDVPYTVDYDNVIAPWFGNNIPRFSFVLEVVAIDETGNESAPIVIAVDG